MNPKRASMNTGNEFQPPEELHPDTEVGIGSNRYRNHVRSKPSLCYIFSYEGYIYICVYIYIYIKIYNMLICIWCGKIKPYWIQHAKCAALCCSIQQSCDSTNQGHVTVAPGVEISPTGPSDSDYSERFGTFSQQFEIVQRCNEHENSCNSCCVTHSMCLCRVLEDCILETWELKCGRSNMQSETKQAEHWLSKGPVPVLGSSMNATFLNISNESGGWEVPYTGSLGVKDFNVQQTC